MGGSSSGNGQIIGYKYYLSVLMGLGHGPIDGVTSITVGDQEVWSGEMTDGEALTIDKPNLFGGQSGEGGISGTVTAFFGKATQVIPASVKQIIGGFRAVDLANGYYDYIAWYNKSPYVGNPQLANEMYLKMREEQKAASGTLISDLRGVATMWFDGMICWMNPYPKTWKMRYFRRMAGWDGPVWQPSLCEIDLTATVSVEITDSNGSGTGAYKDVTGTIRAMNGVHIIYQLLTDRIFGRGFPRAWIDDVSFLAAAKQLKAEGMGLCLSWDTKNSSLSDVMQQVVETIGAALRIDRVSGLIALKLIRDDYSPDLLPTFDRNSGLISVEVDQSSANGNEINEQIVTYYDPISDNTRQVRAQNLGSMQTLGFKNSTSTDYAAVPTAALAGRIASRDLKAQGTSLKKYTITLDRRAWRISQGDVIRISLPERGIQNVVIRVGTIQDSSLTDGAIKVTGVLDVFGLPTQAYTGSVVSNNWTPPATSASVVSTYALLEASYRDVVRNLGSDNVAGISRSETAFVAYAGKPATLSLSYSIQVGSTSGGVQSWGTESARSPFAAFGVLLSPIGRWTPSFAILPVSAMSSVATGQAVQVGDEIMRVDGWDSTTNTLTVSRACVDTIPEIHNAGDTVVFLDAGALSDNAEHGIGENLKVRFLTHNLNTSTDASVVPVGSLVTTGRQGKPWPPANVQINGARFDSRPVVSGDVTISWVGRNRILIQDVLIPFEASGQALEADTSIRMQVSRGTELLYDLTFPSGTTSWVWAKTDQIAALADAPIADGATATISVSMWALYAPGSGQTMRSWKTVQFSLLLTGALEGTRIDEPGTTRVDEIGRIRQVETGAVALPQHLTVAAIAAVPAVADIIVTQGIAPQSLVAPAVSSTPVVGTVVVAQESGSQSVTLPGVVAVPEIAAVSVAQAADGQQVNLSPVTAKPAIGSVVVTSPQMLVLPTADATPAIATVSLQQPIQGVTLDMGSDVMPGVLTNGTVVRYLDDGTSRLLEDGTIRYTED